MSEEPTYFADYRHEAAIAQAEARVQPGDPGQWIAGEWREYDRADAEDDR